MFVHRWRHTWWWERYLRNVQNLNDDEKSSHVAVEWRKSRIIDSRYPYVCLWVPFAVHHTCRKHDQQRVTNVMGVDFQNSVFWQRRCDPSNISFVIVDIVGTDCFPFLFFTNIMAKYAYAPLSIVSSLSSSTSSLCVEIERRERHHWSLFQLVPLTILVVACGYCCYCCYVAVSGWQWRIS